MAKAFCLNCGSMTGFEIFTRSRTMEVWGLRFDYEQSYATCRQCGEEMHVPEVNDRNVRERAAAFRKAKMEDDNGHA